MKNSVKILLKQGLKNPKAFFQFVLSFPKIIRLIWRLFKDRRTPFQLKALILLALAYMISPLDIIPDFIIPGIGYIDDFFLFILACQYFLKNSPPELIAEHVQEIEGKEMK